MNNQRPLIQQGTIDFIKKIRGRKIRLNSWKKDKWAIYYNRFKQDQILLKNQDGQEIWRFVYDGFDLNEDGVCWEFYNIKKVMAIVDSFDYITKDYIYEVINEDNDNYNIITDYGTIGNYSKIYFKEVPDIEDFETATINQCDCDRWGYEEKQLFTSRYKACRKCGKEKK